MKTLKVHDEGVEVYFLQQLLNNAVSRSGGKLKFILQDGVFDNVRTKPAVCAFQSAKRLWPDGVVGKKTWAALGLKEEIEHKLVLCGQPNDWTCWHTAVNMILTYQGKRNILFTSRKHLRYYCTPNRNGRQADIQLASELGWTRLDYKPALPHLISIMKQTPIYVAYENLYRGTAHAIVFGALYSNGDPSGTIIKVYNPSPQGKGCIHSLKYEPMISPFSGSLLRIRDILIPGTNLCLTKHS